jgi:hypothetical protein
MSSADTMELIADLVPPKSRLLDLGCGQGELLFHLTRDRARSGYGIELNDANVPLYQGSAAEGPTITREIPVGWGISGGVQRLPWVDPPISSGCLFMPRNT